MKLYYNQDGIVEKTIMDGNDEEFAPNLPSIPMPDEFGHFVIVDGVAVSQTNKEKKPPFMIVTDSE